MERLDRLGWAAGIAAVSFGLRIGIRVTDAAALQRLLDCLPPGWKPATSPVVDRLYSVVVGGDGARPGVRLFHLLYDGPSQLTRTMDFKQLGDQLDDQLKLYVAEFARRRLFVHAGAVGWQGRAILLPGPSFTGKSTLIAALLRAGATYYSDEYAVLDGRGRVHPYPRPLSLRGETGESSARNLPEFFGSKAGAAPLPVGLVVTTSYQAGARWRPRAMSPGAATLALFANTVSARRQPAVVMQTLQQTIAGARLLRGKRGEADETAALLLHACAMD